MSEWVVLPEMWSEYQAKLARANETLELAIKNGDLWRDKAITLESRLQRLEAAADAVINNARPSVAYGVNGLVKLSYSNVDNSAIDALQAARGENEHNQKI